MSLEWEEEVAENEIQVFGGERFDIDKYFKSPLPPTPQPLYWLLALLPVESTENLRSWEKEKESHQVGGSGQSDIESPLLVDPNLTAWKLWPQEFQNKLII